MKNLKLKLLNIVAILSLVLTAKAVDGIGYISFEGSYSPSTSTIAASRTLATEIGAIRDNLITLRLSESVSSFSNDRSISGSDLVIGVNPLKFISHDTNLSAVVGIGASFNSALVGYTNSKVTINKSPTKTGDVEYARVSYRWLVNKGAPVKLYIIPEVNATFRGDANTIINNVKTNYNKVANIGGKAELALGSKAVNIAVLAGAFRNVYSHTSTYVVGVKIKL